MEEVRPSETQTTVEILRRNIEFRWQGDQTWVGLTQSELLSVVSDIAAFIGLTSERAGKINIIFADHYVPPAEEGIHYSTAFCRIFFDESTNKILRCKVVINRSLELHEYAAKCQAERLRKMAGKLRHTSVIDRNSAPHPLICHFHHPWEEVFWIISEELDHAHTALVANCQENYHQWCDSYIAYLRSRKFKTADPYAADLYEVAASRVALRILTLVSANAQRKAYFRDLYLQSLAKGCHVTTFCLIDTFIQTGFRPPSVLNNFLSLFAK